MISFLYILNSPLPRAVVMLALKLKLPLEVVDTIPDELTVGLSVVVPLELLLEETALLLVELPLVVELDPLLPMPVVLTPPTVLTVDVALMPLPVWDEMLSSVYISDKLSKKSRN
jgi:hypothetical protein